MTVIGKSDIFYAEWDCLKQRYDIYKHKDGKFVIYTYDYSTMKTYIA